MTPMPPRILRIVEQVAQAHDVTVDGMLSHSRRRDHVRARWAVWAILEAEGKSLHQIGSYFGKDHTSVEYGLGRLSARRPQRLEAAA